MSQIAISLALVAFACCLPTFTAANEPDADPNAGLRVRFPDPNVFQSPYTLPTIMARRSLRPAAVI